MKRCKEYDPDVCINVFASGSNFCKAHSRLKKAAWYRKSLEGKTRSEKSRERADAEFKVMPRIDLVKRPKVAYLWEIGNLRAV